MRRRVPGLALLITVGGTFLVSAGLGRAGDPPVLPAPRTVADDTFATSSACALCHDFSPGAEALRDHDGRSVAPFDLWQSSMMANAARDPLWRAQVSVEVAATPAKRSAIEAKCLRCHAPMAGEGAALGDLHADSDRAAFGLDGASCTVCHQIRDEGLGGEERFSGHFAIDRTRRIFGPHREPFLRPMQRHVDYTATHSTHIRDPGLCATCHTLFTEALAPDGSSAGSVLPEQTPYLEWRNSDYTTETAEPGPLAASCQACHLPATDVDGVPIMTRIAHNPGGRDFPPLRPRLPFGRHVLVGGNTLVPALLRDGAEVLRPQASADAFDATLEEAGMQLARAAALSLLSVKRSAERLSFRLRVENRTGHRLPTGHPIRRMWLAVRVTDAKGNEVFASGAFDAEGRILGEDGRTLASERAGGPVEEHRDVIRSADEVALFEARMADASGEPTWLLLRGARFRKDDRLLPQGWRNDGPHASAIGPRGVAGDGDFGAGADAVGFEIPLGNAAPGPLHVDARLCYQTLGARWAAELLAWDTPEVEALRQHLQRADRRPAILVRLAAEIP